VSNAPTPRLRRTAQQWALPVQGWFRHGSDHELEIDDPTCASLMRGCSGARLKPIEVR